MAIPSAAFTNLSIAAAKASLSSHIAANASVLPLPLPSGNTSGTMPAMFAIARV